MSPLAAAVILLPLAALLGGLVGLWRVLRVRASLTRALDE